MKCLFSFALAHLLNDTAASVNSVATAAVSSTGWLYTLSTHVRITLLLLLLPSVLLPVSAVSVVLSWAC